MLGNRLQRLIVGLDCAKIWHAWKIKACGRGIYLLISQRCKEQRIQSGAEDLGLGETSCTGFCSLLSPRITEKPAVPWGRGRGAPLLLLLPWREGLCSPSIALLVGFWRFCAREELGGVSLPGEKVGTLSRAQPPPSPGS